jgi:hypothetical protein
MCLPRLLAHLLALLTFLPACRTSILSTVASHPYRHWDLNGSVMLR